MTHFSHPNTQQRQDMLSNALMGNSGYVNQLAQYQQMQGAQNQMAATHNAYNVAAGAFGGLGSLFGSLGSYGGHCPSPVPPQYAPEQPANKPEPPKPRVTCMDESPLFKKAEPRGVPTKLWLCCSIALVIAGVWMIL